jgi:hypothetical protein
MTDRFAQVRWFECGEEFAAHTGEIDSAHA